MGFNLASFPQAVIKQATQPTASAGALWWDTDDLILYYYSGTSWVQISSSADAGGWEQDVSQLTLELLRISAEGTLTAPDYDNMFVDYFSDANGQDNTIDTGATTSIFLTDAYNNGADIPTLDEAHEQAMASTTSNTADHGFKITSINAQKLLTVTKHASTAATRCQLLDSSKSVLATASFVGDDATFTYDLLASTTYYVVCDDSGSSHVFYYHPTGTSYPINKTNINYVLGKNGANPDDDGAYSILSITTGAPVANTIIKTNAAALSFTPVYALVHCKDITLGGTGNVTFDISYDGGATQDSTGNALDTKIAVVDGSSKNLEITLNLNGTGAGNTASIKDYTVILWSS